MIVTDANISRVRGHLIKERFLAVDTETTGLRPYHGDVLFSIIVSSPERDFYFNFNAYPDTEPLPDKAFLVLREIFANPHRTTVFHNAKFDLAFLCKEGIEVKGDVVDIWSLSRLDFNDNFTYDLRSIAKKFNLSKSDLVEEYIKKNKLWEWRELKHLNRRFKDKRYNEVPLEIVRQYGEQDGRITFECFEKLRDSLNWQDETSPSNIPKLSTVAGNEAKLTKTLFNMEWTGVKVDTSYCREAVEYYEAKIEELKKDFKSLTDHEFQKSPLLFKELFKDETWVFTEKGNPQFDAKALRGFKHPAAKLITKYSEYKKQIEYFQGFLYHVDDDGVIHTNFKQAGTATGRLSSSEPNLQNLTKPDKYEASNKESKFPVRRAFVPREGYFFAMLDFKQMEYRMMLDMANASGLITKIKGGLDVHQATADLAGVTRGQAKTVNFAVLYGSGLKTLGESLGCSAEKAKNIRDTIFRAAPQIRDFIRGVSRTAERRGHIFNWLGRRSHFENKNLSYKAPNYLIQGGCADVVKEAMNECQEFLEKGTLKSRMLLTIHDELVFEIADGEEHILQKLQEIMEGVYPYKNLPLTCGIDYSTKSLADKLPWSGGELGKETGDVIQGEGKAEARQLAEHLGRENSATLH